VTTELQRGYMLRDRVLRPALVAVAKAADGQGAPPAADNDNRTSH